MLTPVPIFLSNPSFTLLRRGGILSLWRRLRRVLGLCYWGRSLGRFRSWINEGFCIFRRRRLDVLVVLVESRLVLDDHGGMIKASGLHWSLNRTRSMEVRYSLLCDAHCCTSFPSTLTCCRTVNPQQLPPWSSQRPDLDTTRERNKTKRPSQNSSQRMNTLLVCHSMSPI